MRSVLTFILILISLCVLLLGSAALWAWHQLTQLPVSDISLRPAAISLNSARLHSLNFTYTDGAMRAPVAIENFELHWEWDGFTPRVQDVQINQLSLDLKSLPTSTAQSHESFVAWPESWQLPPVTPARLSVETFRLTLPCAQATCEYHGSFYAHHRKALEVSATLGVGPPSSNAPQIAVQGYYRVTQKSPEVALQLESGKAFTLDLNASLNSERLVQGSIDGTLSTIPPWMRQQTQQWQLTLPEGLTRWSERLPKPWLISGQWQVVMPEQLTASWSREIRGEAKLEASLSDLASLALQTSIEQNAATRIHGRGQLSVQPKVADLNTNLIPGQLQPYIEQLKAPLEVSSDWDFQLANSIKLPFWQRMQGSADIALNLDQSLWIDQVGEIQASAQASLEVDAGELTGYQISSEGTLSNMPYVESAADWQFDPDSFNWALRSDGASLPSAAQPLTLSLEVFSTGKAQISLFSDLRIDLANKSMHSPVSTFTLRQASWEHQDAKLRNIVLSIPFSFNAGQAGFKTQGTAPAQLSLTADYASYSAKEVALKLEQWHAQGESDDLPAMAFDTAAVLELKQVTGPSLHPQDVSWAGTLSAADQQLTSEAQLRNSHGLVVTNQMQLTTQTLGLQWQLQELFWLAGNPLRASLSAWPELLTLERGRSSARGEISMEFAESSLNFLAEADLADVAGLYDTTSFSGLNSEPSLSSDGTRFEVNVPALALQRLTKGIEVGPVQAQGSYEAALAAPLHGLLQVDANRVRVFSGEVSIENTSYDFADESVLFNIAISQLDLGLILSEYPASDLSGSGILSGTIPVRWSEEGLRIDTGTLAAQPPGGELRYQSERAQQLGERNQAMKLVVDALEDFHYSLLESTVSYYDDGTLELELAIEGHNPSWQHNRPVHLKVNLQEDLPALIASLQLTNQVNSIIQERVQKRLLESLRQ